MTCQRTSKIGHVSRRAAQAHIESLAARGSHDLRAYRCGDHWHVGHHRNELIRRIRASLAPQPRRGQPFTR